MVDNYKVNLEKLSHTDLLRVIEITPALVERMEVHLAGAKHSADHNGPDGHFKDGKHVEVKTQKYTGNYTLRGRGKFGNPTYELYEQKLNSNELIIITGFDTSGQVYYRFSITFDAIKDLYRAAVVNNQRNYDFVPCQYANHSSFKVLFLAEPDLLALNKRKFQPKFLKFLTFLHENNDLQLATFY